ncbi:MAG: META domain-containing protein [Chloroflexota bacterium]|nr:MAG: META domain-containing protein [Chloroflexota bacterium]
MRKMSTLLALAALVMLAVACVGSEPADEPTAAPEPAEEPALAPEPTDEPTEAPSEEPTPEPTPEPASNDDIVNTIWQWSDLVETEPAAQSVVPDPERYTVIFRPDGSANLQADCNFLNVSYAVDGSSLTFDMFGPSTLAFCGEDSLDQQFLAFLGQVASFSLEDGRLKLSLADEAGEMGYVNGGPAEEPVIDEQPEEAAVDIVGETWSWTEFNDQAGESDIDVLNPENYTLTLMPDGTASIQADCNMVSWTYTLEGSSLTFNTLGPSTLAFCGEQSLDQQYLALLGNTATYVTDEGNLILNLAADAGNMVFAAPKLTGAVWQWESIVTPVESFENPNPEQYTVRFGEDGAVNVKAGCNLASGSYTADESGFAIDLGPATLAECGPESLSSDFIQALGAAAIPFFLDGKLYMDLFADSGTLRFGAAAGATVTGTVTYHQRIALPEDAMVTVQIQDTYRADAPAEVIGEQIIETNGRQVPIPYMVSYNPDAIVENHTYTMSAQITDGQGTLLFTNDSSMPVITNGNPTTDVEIVVVPVG